MTTDVETLRREADRAAKIAAEAETKARAVEERRAQMLPRWRVADLLHRYFARTYPGAGAAMDGGDPWGYEIPAGQDNWKREWTSPGREHQHFLTVADTLVENWIGPRHHSQSHHSQNVSYEQVENMLKLLIDAIGPSYSLDSVRSRHERYVRNDIERKRKAAHEAIDGAINLASER